MAGMRLFALLGLSCLSCVAFAAPSPVVAKVNGEPIYRAELERQMESRKDDAAMNPEVALQKLILFHLAVQEARQQQLDRDPNVKFEMERVLYKAYLDGKLSAARQTLEPAEKELHAFYDEAPLVRARHLVLMARNPAEKEEALKTAALIQKKVREGKDFKTLVLEYSQDDSARMGGDLDFRGLGTLPPEIYEAALKLKPGELGHPVELGEALHLIQLTEKKRYADAPATYLEMLRTKLRQRREDHFLASLFEKLKSGAHVEVFAKQTHDVPRAAEAAPSPKGAR